MNQNDSSNQNPIVPSRMNTSPASQSERMFLVREANPTNNLRDYVSILFKQKIGIVAAFLVISIIGTALAIVYKKWIYTPTFQARASLLIKSGWENYSPNLSLEKRPVPSLSQNEILGSEIRILQSRELKEKVISSLKPETIFPSLAKDPSQSLINSDRALVLFDKYLTVRSGGAGNIIEVLFNGSDPAKAAAVVNQLVNSYIDKRTEIYKDPKSVLFLEKKAEEYGQKLAESEKKLRTFRDETKIVSFDEQRIMLLNQQSSLVTSIHTTSNQMKEVQERISELEKQLSSLPKTTTTVAAAERQGDAENRLFNLRLQEKELLSKYFEDNRLVVNLREQIKMVEEHMKSQAAGSRNAAAPAPVDPVYQDVQRQILQSRTELSTLKIRYATTEKELGELNTAIQVFETRENRYKELTRAVSSNEENYNNYRQKLEESKLYDELDRQKMTSVSVIEPAAVPMVPAKPPMPLVLLIAGAIVAGLAGSFGIAYIRELGKQVMSTAAEAEKRLDLPVLVTIPIKG